MVADPTKRLFWVRSSRYHGDPETGYDIRLVRAPTFDAAAVLFGPQTEGFAQIHDCTTPELVAEADSHPMGVVWTRRVADFPSATDEFRRGGTYDYAAMEDAGFDRT